MKKIFMSEKFKTFYERYHHALPLLIYGVFYLVWFHWLEVNVTRNYHIIHMAADDYIPFCEVFIIPYLLWFVYVSGVVIYFFFKDKEDYYKTCVFLFTGMTIFLIISTLWPNGHHLRPHVFPRENIFTDMIKALWRVDTPTNLWPSIHVYNSLGAHFAIIRSKAFENNKKVKAGSLVMAVSIIASTMLIKQHSVFDVMTAFLMAAVMYSIVYRHDLVYLLRESYQRKKSNTQTA
jgi:membrane-associated phospholipid phosphatase